MSTSNKKRELMAFLRQDYLPAKTDKAEYAKYIMCLKHDFDCDISYVRSAIRDLAYEAERAGYDDLNAYSDNMDDGQCKTLEFLKMYVLVKAAYGVQPEAWGNDTAITRAL